MIWEMFAQRAEPLPLGEGAEVGEGGENQQRICIFFHTDIHLVTPLYEDEVEGVCV